MGVETKEREIDGHKYTVTQFTGRKGAKYFARLGKILGPVVGELSMDEDDAEDSSLKAMSVFFDRFNPEQDIDFIVSLLANTRRDGEEITPTSFDMHFAGKFDVALEVALFVAEVNWGRLLKKVGVLQESGLLANPSISQNTSEMNGQSGV